MKHLMVILSLAALCMLLITASCSFSVSTARVENAHTARDQVGKDPTSQFAPSDAFFLAGDLANASDDTRLKTVWTAVEAQGVDPNMLIKESEVTGGSGPFWFTLTSTSGQWPAGKYKVELYMNDKLEQTLEFQVIAPPEPTQPPTPTQPPAAIQLATPTSEASTGSETSISNVMTTRDEAGEEPTTAFAQADKIYTYFTLQAGSQGAAVKATFIASDAEGVAPETLVNEIEENFNSGQSYVVFENTKPWPKGNYRIELSVNGQPAQTLDIEVISTNSSGAAIEKAYAAFDEEGQQVTENFTVDNTVYILFKLASAPEDTQVLGVMVAVEAQGLDAYTYITDASGSMGSGEYWFEFTNDGPWNMGNYIVFIYLDGEIATQVEFKIQ
jgi:hypothetical protein